MSRLGIITTIAMLVMAPPLLPANGDVPLSNQVLPAPDVIKTGKDKWELYRDTVIQRKKYLETQFRSLDGMKYADSLYDLEDTRERLRLLRKVIREIGRIKRSSEAYGFSPSNKDTGSTLYIRDSGCIMLTYRGTAGFVHEIMHAAQYERGDIAYWTEKEEGYGLLLDLNDEVEAYKAQYAFDRYSIPAKRNGDRIQSFKEINTEWVSAIIQLREDTIGGKKVINIKHPYEELSKMHLTINSPWDSIIRSYPDVPGWEALKNRYPSIKEVKEVKYKGKRMD